VTEIILWRKKKKKGETKIMRFIRTPMFGEILFVAFFAGRRRVNLHCPSSPGNSHRQADKEKWVGLLGNWNFVSKRAPERGLQSLESSISSRQGSEERGKRRKKDMGFTASGWLGGDLNENPG
jgi:hypothetical protein